MKLSSKIASGIAGLALIVGGAGCGGFSGSKSVSPASFFLPGAKATSPVAPVAPAPGVALAQNQPGLNPTSN